MKLASYRKDGSVRIGTVSADESGLIDLSQYAPELPTDMSLFLAAGDKAMQAARKIAAEQQPTDALADVELLAPVPRPGKILAIGLNYKDHVEETGMETPKHQMWFNKQVTAANGPYAPVDLPSVSPYLDYEGELCFVIGKQCRHVPKERAHEVIAGYCIGNDVSVRDWQMRVQTMQIGKSFDTHAPYGPFLVTPDEVGDPHALDIKTWVNGELRQDSNTSNLIFDCFDQIAHLTQAHTLMPGDVIFTGTASGVGAAFKPPKFLVEGDVVKIAVDKLGYIENKVVQEVAETRIG